MTEFTSSVSKKPAPRCRKKGRAIILIVCGMFALTALVACYAVTVVVATVFNGLGAVFQGIFEAVASMFSMVIVVSVLVIFPWLMEMATLLSTGQLIPFVMRLLQLLRSS